MGAAARKRRAAVVCEISRRRRAAGFVAAQSAAAAAAATARRERVARENRVRLDWEQRMRTLSPKEFRLTYRMDSEAFGILLERVRPAITTANPTQARRSSGSEVSAVCRLSMTLRWLAGGCVHDIYQMHGVAYNTFYNSLWKTVDAINNHPLHKFKFGVTEQRPDPTAGRVGCETRAHDRPPSRTGDGPPAAELPECLSEGAVGWWWWGCGGQQSERAACGVAN